MRGCLSDGRQMLASVGLVWSCFMGSVRQMLGGVRRRHDGRVSRPEDYFETSLECV
jgi:hypothetical protein